MNLTFDLLFLFFFPILQFFWIAQFCSLRTTLRTTLYFLFFFFFLSFDFFLVAIYELEDKFFSVGRG